MAHDKNRKDVLEDLVNYKRPLDIIGSELMNFPWDTDELLVELNREHIVHVIQLFLGNKITEENLVEWANLVEVRDGIYFEKDFDYIISDTLFKLSTPEINSPLNRENLLQLLSHLVFNEQ